MDRNSVKNCATVTLMRQKLDNTIFRYGSQLAWEATRWTGYASAIWSFRLANHTVYKANATNTDVASLDKNGSAGQGTDVHFICTIVRFVKDSTGVTAGANVTDSASSSGSFIQVIFTPSTDITKLNTGDVLEVWGNDQGASSGTNAFGATIQEVVIQAQYMIDQTTVYRVDS